MYPFLQRIDGCGPDQRRREPERSGMPGRVRGGRVPQSSERRRFSAFRREMDGLRVGYGRQTLLAAPAQPTFGQDRRWNESRLGKVG